MKNLNNKKFIRITTLLVITGYGLPGHTVCVGVGGNFGASQIVQVTPSGTQFDNYEAVCPAGATGLSTKISLKTPNPAVITIRVKKEGFVPVVTASDNAPSASTGCTNALVGGAITVGALTSSTLFGGAGKYDILVFKSSSSPSSYAMQFDCAGTTSPPSGPHGGLFVDRIWDF